MKVDVLGLGESLQSFVPSDNFRIGVNDIHKHHEVDVVVCVDRISAFTPERFESISKSTHSKFYTHHEEWKGQVKNVQMINLSGPRGSIKGIETQDVPYSNNSTFVAVVLAYKHGATEINIFGADFNTHPNFMNNKLEIALKDFKQLFDYLRSKKVKINVSEGSKLRSL
ncbi:MAG: hypothetical protein KUG64_10300 [Cycloclasticus sp.]|nr:hypothetical protein [Cycloclasticus sp.]